MDSGQLVSHKRAGDRQRQHSSRVKRDSIDCVVGVVIEYQLALALLDQEAARVVGRAKECELLRLCFRVLGGHRVLGGVRLVPV